MLEVFLKSVRSAYSETSYIYVHLTATILLLLLLIAEFQRAQNPHKHVIMLKLKVLLGRSVARVQMSLNSLCFHFVSKDSKESGDVSRLEGQVRQE